MDFIEGIPLSRKQELLHNEKYDVKKSVKSYVVSAIRNWLIVDSDFYFQADPHFSNILALPNGDAAAVDYGLISVMTKREVQLTTDLVIAVYLRDLDQTIRIMAEMTGVEYDQCYSRVRNDFEHFLDEAQQRGFGFWFLDFAKIMVKNKLKYPEFLITFGRAACLLDGLVHEYLPGQTTLDILGDEFRRAVFHRTFKNVFKANWLRVLYSLGKKINESPRLIENFVEHPLTLISELAKAVKNAVA
jgi:predicted unusual protein kinase regulating ubiquinone biosynthesis (AarF/ABC1/UbiB family)